MNVRRSIHTIMLAATEHPPARMNRDILSALPPMVSSITAGGKVTALRLTEIRKSSLHFHTPLLTYSHSFASVPVSSDAAASIAHTLTLALRNSNSFDARVTTVELLSRLFHKYQNTAIIDTAIPDLIAIVLDENDSVGGARLSALQLLVARASNMYRA